MEIPVQIATSDPIWAEQQARALNFWTAVLDMNWYPVDKAEDCALAFVDGNPSFMDPETIGIAQMPTWKGFQGLIAVNLSESARTPEQKFTNAVHELGHICGLAHNSIAASIMCPYDVGTYKVLMKPDLAALSQDNADERAGAARQFTFPPSGITPETDQHRGYTTCSTHQQGEGLEVLLKPSGVLPLAESSKQPAIETNPCGTAKDEGPWGAWFAKRYKSIVSCGPASIQLNALSM